MEINKKILSIPPYLSTSWKDITSLYIKETNNKPVLMVALTSGPVVEIPHLEEQTINLAFQAHAEFLKNPQEQPIAPTPVSTNQSIGLKFPFPGGDQIAQFGAIMEHNSDQMHAAPIPKEALDKITAIANTVGIDLSIFPKPEPHCNCPHCQVAKAIHHPSDENPHQDDDTVTEEDLQFRDWDIEQSNDQLFIVTNPLDKKEHYQVFLGEPLGCTCGDNHCEHIRAVLRT